MTDAYHGLPTPRDNAASALRHRQPPNLTGVMASRVVALVAERLVPRQFLRTLRAGIQCRPLFHGVGQSGYCMQHARTSKADLHRGFGSAPAHLGAVTSRWAVL
jgi:hypothetical protein